MPAYDSTREQILRELAELSHRVVQSVSVPIDSCQLVTAEKERWLSALVENSTDLIGLVSLDGKVLYLNRAGHQLLGLEASEESQSMFGFFTGEEQSRLRGKVIPALLEPKQWFGEFRLRHFQTGENIPFAMSVFLVRDPQTCRPTGLAAIGRRLAESLHLHQDLRESEEFYRTLIETLPVTVVFADPQAVITYISPAAKDMFGLEPGQGVGTLPTDWIAAEQHNVVLQRMHQVLVEMRPQPPMEYKMFKRDGTPLWASLTSSPVINAHGRLKGVVTVCQNITGRKQAEEQLKALNETLERRVAERTAVAEQRAAQLQAMTAELTQAEHRERRRLAQVLHDHLQQMLVAARLKLGQVNRHSTDDRQRQAIRQIDHLLQQSIAESRSLTAQLSPPVLYDRGLAAGLEWLGRQTHEKYLLAVEVDADPAAEPAEESLRVFLFQAVRELLLNVAKHAQAQHVWVRMSKADGQVELEVRDDGVGLDPAQAARTPETGFGMLSIRERLERLGGRMEVASRPGHGTQVVIRVPRGQAAPSAVERPAPVHAAPVRPTSSGKLRVLLADDHPIVRKGLVDLLAEHPELELVGEACDGQEAVDMALQTRPDVVMMDVTMPRLSGIEATRRITSALPEARVIGLSIHEEQDMAAAMNQAGAVAYLGKDVPPDALTTTILAQSPAARHGG